MTGVLTISRARRVRIHQILSGISNTQVASISFLMMVDGVILSASRKTVGNGDNNPATDASGSYLTPVLSAGAHTFQMQWSTTNGQATLPAAGATNAGFQLEETVFES